jgi:hypothetical protein
MGAVSSRWYAVRLAPEKVHTWIGIASANHGTDALCGHHGAGNKEMCPAFASSRAESATQFELNGSKSEPRDESPYGLGADSAGAPRIAPDETRAIRYFTVRIEPDEWIVPANSATLDGAGVDARKGPRLPGDVRATSPGNFLLNRRVDHDGLTNDASVIELTIALLGWHESP